LNKTEHQRISAKKKSRVSNCKYSAHNSKTVITNNIEIPKQ